MKTTSILAAATAAIIAAAMFPPAPAAAESRVVIRGSNTFGEELGPRLIEAFREERPDIEFTLGTEGSGSGMNALLNGECDLASTSRVASEDELRRARALGLRLQTHFIGSYGVSVIVNEKAGVRDLTPAQVRDLFTGKIDNWKAVGGRDLPVRLYIRDPVSGTYLGFRELAMEDRPYAESARPLTSYSAIAEAVAAEPGGVGYMGMTLKTLPGVHAVRISGIPPNLISVNEGMYPYARGLRFYTVRGRESAEARAFARFVRESRGQALLQELGFVPRVMLRIDPGSPVH